MKAIKRILVVMDSSTDHQASLVQAINIAEKTSATLELFLVAYHSDFVSHWNFSQTQLDALQQEYIASKVRWLESYLPEIKALDIVVHIDVVWHSDVSCAILAKVTSDDFSMVVKSTKKDTTINKIFFTPSDWQLLEHCSVPLLLTKNINQHSYHTIMAAIDPDKTDAKGEKLDIKVLKEGVAMAELFDGQAHVCHCYQPIDLELWQGMSSVGMSSVGMNYSLANGDFNDYKDKIKSHHKIAFDELLSNFSFDDELTHLVVGSAEDELPKLVQAHNVDLLVMGMSNNGKFIGNTIEKILDNVKCDILSIKHAS